VAVSGSVSRSEEMGSLYLGNDRGVRDRVECI
jgi:hypothetical protein